MKDNRKATILIIVCTIFTSIGQIAWKLGADRLELTIIGLLTNYPLILGFVSYAIGTVLLVTALKYGELSKVYPFIALSFIWVGIMSVIMLGETITLTKILAMIFIVVGVAMVAGIGDSINLRSQKKSEIGEN